MADIPYSTPGVYLEEVPSGDRPIQAVGTSTAGFVGSVPNPKCEKYKPVAVNSWAEFVRRFMTPDPVLNADLLQVVADKRADLDAAIKAISGTNIALSDRKTMQKKVEDARDALVKATNDLRFKSTDLSNAVYGFYLNGGTRCWVVNVGPAPDTTGAVQQLPVDAGTTPVQTNLPAGSETTPTQTNPPAGAETTPAQTNPPAGAETTPAQTNPPAGAGTTPAQTNPPAGAGTTPVQTNPPAGTETTTVETKTPVTVGTTPVETKPLTVADQAVSVSTPLAGADQTPVAVEKPSIIAALIMLEKVDEVAIVAAPGYTDPASYDAIRNHCDKLRDRVGILDGPPVLDDAAVDLLGGTDFGNANWWKPFPSEYGQLTLYVPWIEIVDPSTITNNGGTKTMMAPPSGHVAGVWARSDATRGVHKAPANEPLRGALGLERQITQEEQGPLNRNGVNVIRYFSNEGFLVWGARTLTLDTSFTYLNIRRLFNMIEESIVESTRWIVFEPNDRPLWQAIRRDVTAFLMGFWRSGALMGRTPQEAFFVKCDEENNPIDSIRLGRVVIEIGLAPVYPAEFVIFKISQYQAKTEVEVQPA